MGCPLDAVIEARGLSKSYGALSVVRGLDFTVQSGECLGLLGPNGAGKSTTLGMLLGLVQPDAGSLRVLGEPIPQRARAARMRIGVVPQQDNLDPDFTVAENLLVYGSYFGLSGAQVRARVPELLAYAALEGRATARVPTLSGGMRRRLTLARALVNDPELLLLDEPTTGLDPQARQLIWQRLRTLRDTGKTLLLTTHHMEEAERLCDRVLILDQGRVLDAGSPQALVARHVEPHVFEVYGPGVHGWLSSLPIGLLSRSEQVGDTAFCYASDAAAVQERLAGANGLRHLERRAGLEDVFLKLTGRGLRDG